MNMTNELQEIKNRLDQIEAIIKPAAIDLNNRCCCGALMIKYDDSDANCKGYKCPACGSMKFSHHQVQN